MSPALSSQGVKCKHRERERERETGMVAEGGTGRNGGGRKKESANRNVRVVFKISFTL